MQCSTFEHIFPVITDSEPSDTRMPLTITCIRTTWHSTGRANGSRVLGMMGQHCRSRAGARRYLGKRYTTIVSASLVMS
jgi:hypothetical protein